MCAQMPDTQPDFTCRACILTCIRSRLVGGPCQTLSIMRHLVSLSYLSRRQFLNTCTHTLCFIYMHSNNVFICFADKSTVCQTHNLMFISYPYIYIIRWHLRVSQPLSCLTYFIKLFILAFTHGERADLGDALWIMIIILIAFLGKNAY